MTSHSEKKSKESSLPVIADEQVALNQLPVHERNPLSVYLREAARYPLLTREEEEILLERVKNHQDRDAAKILAQSNLRFVIKIAFEYVRTGARIMDLIQEGNVGLIRAIQEFDPSFKTKLITYAVYWIRSYIQDYLLKNWSLVRIGTTKSHKKLFYNLKKAQEELERQGITPHIKALAHKLDVEEEDVTTMQQRLSAPDVSLNAPLGSSKDGDTVESFINRVADSHTLADEEISDQEQQELFQRALEEFPEELDEREKVIFHERLLSENPKTLLEIGESMGFTKERARQLEERVKLKLKKFLEKYYPDITVE